MPLAPPCGPRIATAARQPRPRRSARVERDGGQRELVSGGFDAVHVNEGGLRLGARARARPARGQRGRGGRGRRGHGDDRG